MKMYLDPPKSRGITVQDRSGRELSPDEVSGLANRRVKWARRAGPRVAVMLEGPVKGHEGVLLYFPDPQQYDAAVKKVFTS